MGMHSPLRAEDRHDGGGIVGRTADGGGRWRQMTAAGHARTARFSPHDSFACNKRDQKDMQERERERQAGDPCIIPVTPARN